MKRLFLFLHPYLLIPLYFVPVITVGIVWGPVWAVMTGNAVLALIAAYVVTMKKYV